MLAEAKLEVNAWIVVARLELHVIRPAKIEGEVLLTLHECLHEWGQFVGLRCISDVTALINAGLLFTKTRLDSYSRCTD